MDREILSRVMHLTSAYKTDWDRTRCHICLREVKLSKEHVPPRSAFNNCTALWMLAKEIATMILAVEPAGFGQDNLGFRRFVLDKDATFGPNFRVLAFLVPDSPQAGTFTRFHGRVDTFAPGYAFAGGEISCFPFGFVYTTQIDGGYDPHTLTDVTHWFTKGNKADRHGNAVRLFCRLTGVDAIQCCVGHERVRPQIDYVP
jgi:hypothetical protein